VSRKTFKDSIKAGGINKNSSESVGKYYEKEK